VISEAAITDWTGVPLDLSISAHKLVLNQRFLLGRGAPAAPHSPNLEQCAVMRDEIE
jgi:hypothetical protein